MSTRRIIATYAFVMFFLVIALLGTVTAAFGGTKLYGGRRAAEFIYLNGRQGARHDLRPQFAAAHKRRACLCRCGNSLAGNACQIKPRCTGRKREVLRTALESGKPFLIEVTTPVSADGIQTFSVTKRYANPQPAANLLGYLDSDYNGADGVEKKASTHCLRKTMGKSTLPSPLMRSAMPSPAKQCTWKTHTALRTVA